MQLNLDIKKILFSNIQILVFLVIYFWRKLKAISETAKSLIMIDPESKRPKKMSKRSGEQLPEFLDTFL